VLVLVLVLVVALALALGFNAFASGPAVSALVLALWLF
jgi:hypothetical protein